MYKIVLKSAHFIIFSVLILLLTSCSEPLKKHPLKVGFTTWPGFDIIYYAEVKKLFEKNGISVELVKYQDQKLATKALEHLEVDAVMTSVWDAIHIQGDNSFDIILTTNVSAGADGIVSINKIHSMAELKGKKISAQSNSVNELILIEALQLHNMSIHDVNIVDIINEKALAKIFHNEIEAAVLWEPLLSKTAKKINGNILFTTKEVDSLVVDVLVVNSKSVQTRKKEWEGFLCSWFNIMKDLQKQPQTVFDIVSGKIGDRSFAKDYKGLHPGDTSINTDMFINNQLKDTIDKINKIANIHNHNIHINKSFIKDYIQKYSKQVS